MNKPEMQSVRTTSAPLVEPADAPTMRVALLLAGLIAILLIVCAAVAGLLVIFDRHTPANARPPVMTLTPPEPRLQVDEPAQRRVLEARAEARRDAIGRSMRHVAETGWPGQ